MSYIDTRDLATELDDLELAFSENGEVGALDQYGTRAKAIERMEALRTLQDQIDDFEDGTMLIPVDEFQEYARELAEDINACPDTVFWPFTCIDWAQAAKELAYDYTCVTFDGIDYYVR